MKQNVQAQEEVVAALWAFAAEHASLPHAATNKAGTSVSTEAVGRALDKIMVAFGCEVTEIQ